MAVKRRAAPKLVPEQFSGWLSFLDQMAGEMSDEKSMLAAEKNESIQIDGVDLHLERSFQINSDFLKLYTYYSWGVGSWYVIDLNGGFSALIRRDIDSASITRLIMATDMLAEWILNGFKWNTTREMLKHDLDWNSLVKMDWRINGKHTLNLAWSQPDDWDWDKTTAGNCFTFRGWKWYVTDSFRCEGHEIALCTRPDATNKRKVHFMFLVDRRERIGVSAYASLGCFVEMPLSTLLTKARVPLESMATYKVQGRPVATVLEAQDGRLWF